MGEGTRLRPGTALDEGRRVEPGGVQRLQQIVARRSEEAGLVAVGGVGVLPGAFELGIDPQEGRRALRHPALEGGVCPLQGGFRVNPRRYVGEADHQAAIGQAG